MGLQGRWFYCSASTSNIIARQQSVAFSYSYTERNVAIAGFVVPNANAASFPPDARGKTVGLMVAWAPTIYFKAQQDLFRPSGVVEFASQADRWAALVSGALDAVPIGSTTATQRLSSDHGYQAVRVAAGYSQGLAYGCHPEYGDVVAALNQGLAEFKKTFAYQQLCMKYPEVPCDCMALDCQVSHWSEWGACNTTCGNSTRSRSRFVVANRQQVDTCPVLEELEACSERDCDADYMYLFDGCPDGGLVSKKQMVSVFMSQSTCERSCIIHG